MSAMLTTVDNPYNPFDDYENWYAWDVASGYHSAAMLARIANVSDEMSIADIELAIEEAIDEIVKENVSGVWTKVVDDDSVPTQP